MGKKEFRGEEKRYQGTNDNCDEHERCGGSHTTKECRINYLFF